MDVPDLVEQRLEGERVVDWVDLDGDAVYVTPTRTLVYREEGLLSDESVAAFSHDVDSVELREGRRKVTFRLTDIDGTRDFSVPAARAEDVLAPLLWGVLRAAGVLAEDERVEEAYRFSELTLVVTDARVVKHVGNVLWDAEFEEFPYADLTDLAFEEGSVATAVVLEVGGRRERVKIPNEEARFVRRAIEQAVFDYHGVESLEALRAKVAADEDEPGVDAAANPDADADATEREAAATDAFDGIGFEPLTEDHPDAPAGSAADAPLEAESVGEAGDAEEIAARLDDLEAAVRRQNELLEEQQATIEQLIDELRRGW